MPTNLYDPGDTYDLQTSHVLPALIRKAHEAKQRGDRELVVWRTGRPMWEFLSRDHMACLYLMNLPEGKYGAFFANPDMPPLINIGCGEDQSIPRTWEAGAGSRGFSGKPRTRSWKRSRPTRNSGCACT